MSGETGLFLRRLARLMCAWLPPLAFAAWLVRLFGVWQGYAVPAFGAIDQHVQVWQSRMLLEWALGGALAAVWAVAWRFLKRNPGAPSRAEDPSAAHRRTVRSPD